MIGRASSAKCHSHAPGRIRRTRRAIDARPLHSAGCACGACRYPAEPGPPLSRYPISLLCLIAMAASIGLLFLADAIAGGPGLQVMIGQPGKHQ